MKLGNDINMQRFTKRQKRNFVLLAMLFLWPVVIGLGALLNHVTGSPFPMACLPIIWLLTVAFMIERRLTAFAD